MPPRWPGIESLHESSGSLFGRTRVSCYKLHTSPECARASACRALRETSRFRGWTHGHHRIRVRSSYVHLSSNLANHDLKTEDPSFFTNRKPHQQSLALKKTRTRKT